MEVFQLLVADTNPYHYIIHENTMKSWFQKLIYLTFSLHICLSL